MEIIQPNYRYLAYSWSISPLENAVPALFMKVLQ